MKTILDFRTDRIHDIIYFFKRVGWFLSRWFQWGKVLWHDYDYDYVCIWRILQYKISRMRKHMESCDISPSNKICARRMKVVELLLERLIKDDYCSYEFELYTQKYGSIFDRIERDPVTGFEFIPHMKDEAQRAASKKIHDHQDYLRNQDMEFLNKYLYKYIRTWWD